MMKYLPSNIFKMILSVLCSSTLVDKEGNKFHEANYPDFIVKEMKDLEVETILKHPMVIQKEH